MNQNTLCDCGHSEKDHKMKHTKNFTFSIDNCRECLCEQYTISKNITITNPL